LAAEGLSFNNWASLSDLTVAGFKRVAFVDYFVCQVANKAGLILIRTIPGHSEDDDQPFEIRFNVTDLAEKDINAWAQEKLNRSTLSDYDLADSAFEDLSALAKPLTSLTAEGDVIVFCPTGPLHRLPLHALPTGGDNGEIDLERNPVVYTSSLYSAIQFMRHRQKLASKNLAAVISAYETSNNENPPAEVLAVRNNLTALNTTLRYRAPSLR
jgi:CHAT domain-containing protein